METLALKKPLPTKEPQVAVAAGLKPGRYRLELVVTGSNGSSQPAAMTIQIVDGPTPSPFRPTDLTAVPAPGRIGRVVKPKIKTTIKRIP